MTERGLIEMTNEQELVKRLQAAIAMIEHIGNGGTYAASAYYANLYLLKETVKRYERD
jgi:hypothetical protein